LTVSLIAGAAVVKKEGRDIMVEFGASVGGCYFESGYIHFSKVARGNNLLIKSQITHEKYSELILKRNQSFTS
jgi:hypothetical protein